MRKFLNAAVLVPLGVIFLVFAVANRHQVTVSFDPFNSSDPAFSLALPLFVVIIVSVISGVVAGGCATWIGQRRWRRMARRVEADARELRSQLDDWHRTAASYRQVPNQPQALPEGAYRRDKQGAAL